MKCAVNTRLGCEFVALPFKPAMIRSVLQMGGAGIHCRSLPLTVPHHVCPLLCSNAALFFVICVWVLGLFRPSQSQLLSVQSLYDYGAAG